MDLIISPVNIKDIKKLQIKYGNYIKVTVDINKQILVAGPELHADGEKILLEQGCQQDDVWGGGINLETKEVDSLAVLNLRPKLNNSSLEVLDPEKRKKFMETVKKIFSVL